MYCIGNMKTKAKKSKSKFTKVVINSCYGGFSLSHKAIKLLAEKQGKACYFFKSNLNGENKYELINGIPHPTEWFVHAFSVNDPSEIDFEKNHLESRPKDRADPLLVEVVEELGTEADGPHAELKIVNVPSDIKWSIQEYDGAEWVAEEHRTWS